MNKLMWLPVLAFCWMWKAGEAHACSCERITPVAGYDRAQYVFTGKVVNADRHEWLVEVERIWKSHGRLDHTIKLKDAYAATSCEFFFQQERRYLFFAVVAKGGRDVFYHPQVCNWTSPLKSTRVPTEENEWLWVEELIAREYGPGTPPRDAH